MGGYPDPDCPSITESLNLFAIPVIPERDEKEDQDGDE
jgi:hypothetical protein